MSQNKSLDMEKLLLIFPLAAIILILISFIFPAINVHFYVGDFLVSGNIYLWGFEDGNIGFFLGYILPIGIFARFLILIMMIFGISLTVSIIKLLFSSKRIYLGESSYEEEKRLWLKQGIMIIVHGIIVIVVIYVIFAIVQLFFIGPYMYLSVIEYVSFGFGTISLFIAGGIMIGGVVVGHVLDLKGKLPKTKEKQGKTKTIKVSTWRREKKEETGVRDWRKENTKE